MISFDVLVAVPVSARESVVVAAPDLDESDAPFEEASCSEALAPKNVLLFRGVDFCGPRFDVVADSVHRADGGGFFGDVEGLGRGKLHACREFVAADSGF